MQQPAISSVRRAVVAVTAGALVLGAGGAGAAAQDGAATQARATAASQSAATVPFSLVADRDVDDRLPQPEDRYALAGGCYTIEAPGVGWIGDGVSVTTDPAAAEPFHFQPLRLGDYLLATNDGPDTSFEGATWDVRSYLSGEQSPLPDAVSVSYGVGLVAAPSTAAEFHVTAASGEPDARAEGGQDFAITRIDGLALVVATDGVSLESETVTPTPLRFHHVIDDDPADNDANGTACANWPEVDTNTIGTPVAPDLGRAAEVQGLMESHIHGMAFEFLGGEARCGSPWHKYGVEYALVDCVDHGPGGMTAILEVAVSGADPFSGHDTVGWPTFGYWPKHDSLTHEQVYYKWLERAYLGGLRLYVNLLVENQVLCEIYPVKRNSCNEMDSVRLQARRLFEFQDYIDAQSGGPGEGWLRIVTTPMQAREVINAGRMALIMGIEISTLFDCGEVLDQPLCTADDIDVRLAEAYDMGVRQMELLNKFDSGLAGVTGDGGATGALVNQANRRITGHYWDMLTCVEPEDTIHHEHDKTQPNAVDDIPDDGNGGFDTLAGAIMQVFAPTAGTVAPAYPAGPHCNTRGLTDLGRHLIQQMTARGMMFDPDHMSALAQRQALDWIQDTLIPAEQEAAAAEGRAAIQPAVLSSHSWGNDAIYRRIYEIDGFIGPRTGRANSYADTWAQRKAWFEELAPANSLFGLGYGADTNGFGGQPGPRTEAAVRLGYDQPWEAPIGGVMIEQQVSGLRSYDINTDGVAHYGLFADWYRELQLAADEQYPHLGGGDAIITDMLNAPEAYLRLWERAVYGGNDCVIDGSQPQFEDVHALLGGNVEGFLEAVGQPASRDGAAYTYCVEGADGQLEVLDVVFGADGTAAAIQPSTSGITPIEAAPDHTHDVDVDVAGAALPATGGGGLQPALLLVALAMVMTEVLVGRRRIRGGGGIGV